MTIRSAIGTWLNRSADYEAWMERVESVEPAEQPDGEPDGERHDADGPLFSVVVPCCDPPAAHVAALVGSVVGQSYGRWELCLVDGSIEPESRTTIAALAARDDRIRYIAVPENLGISGNTNLGLESAHGDFVAFADHDDTLAPFALAAVAAALRTQPDLDVVYSDEDKLSEDGRRRLLPFFKPDWSPDLFLGVNYLNHLVVVRRTLLEEVGLLRPDFDGAQDYDLLLRVTERTDRIAHVPRVLYHWRLSPGSASRDLVRKSYADDAGRRALREALRRRGIEGEVLAVPDRPTSYRVRYELPRPPPKVSIIVPFHDNVHLLEQCVGSIVSKSTFENYEILLVSNNSTEPATRRYLDALPEPRCRVLHWDHPFNYAAINNFAFGHAGGDYLVLLNNDTEVRTPNWIEELVGVASQEGVGAVGPILTYPDGRIQHAGIVVGMAGPAGHVFRHRRVGESTDFGTAAWPRDYLAVTGACLAVARAAYEEVGGMDESLAVAGNDVTFCIKLHEAGYRNVCWPFAQLVHHESATVGGAAFAVRADLDRAMQWYGPYTGGRDPYFNPNLDLDDERIRLRLPGGGSGARGAVLRAVRSQQARLRRLRRAYRNLGAAGVVKKAARRARPRHAD